MVNEFEAELAFQAHVEQVIFSYQPYQNESVTGIKYIDLDLDGLDDVNGFGVTSSFDSDKKLNSALADDLSSSHQSLSAREL